MKLLTRVGLGGVVLAAAMVTTPAIASANPIADFFCNTGSAQFCPPPPPPPVLPPPPVVTPPPPPPSGGPAPQAAPPQRAFQYKNCTEARDAGAAPVYRDEYGYGPHLDRDDDGVGCE